MSRSMVSSAGCSRKDLIRVKPWCSGLVWGWRCRFLLKTRIVLELWYQRPALLGMRHAPKRASPFLSGRWKSEREWSLLLLLAPRPPCLGSVVFFPAWSHAATARCNRIEKDSLSPTPTDSRTRSSAKRGGRWGGGGVWQFARSSSSKESLARKELLAGIRHADPPTMTVSAFNSPVLLPRGCLWG